MAALTARSVKLPGGMREKCVERRAHVSILHTAVK